MAIEPREGRSVEPFAGSIGIIGIAAILALSNGVNHSITKTEEDALSSYPLTMPLELSLSKTCGAMP